ncbi:MAG: helix-turn-helix domain-containing protein, partial [Candidatus Macondimonas sp.]
ALLHQPWPGNVRELEHLIGRAALRALSQQPQRPRILTVQAQHLDLSPISGAASAMPAPIAPESPQPVTGLREAVDELQTRLIQEALARHGGNRAAAARELGLDRANLHRLQKRLGLTP